MIKTNHLNWYSAETEESKIVSIEFSEKSIIRDSGSKSNYVVHQGASGTWHLRAKDELHAFALLDKYLKEQTDG